MRKIQGYSRSRKTKSFNRNSFINGGIKQSARPLTKILGGILTSTKSRARDNNDTLNKHFKLQTKLKGINVGCIADYGNFYMDYKSPKKTIQKFGSEKDITGKTAESKITPYLEYYNNRTFINSKFNSPGNSFVTFFMQLTRHLQQSIGTVPAINLNKYLESINEQIDEDI